MSYYWCDAEDAPTQGVQRERQPGRRSGPGMSFNNGLAVFLVSLIFVFVGLAAFLGIENKVVDLALGVFLAKLSDIIQFYYRKIPGREKS